MSNLENVCLYSVKTCTLIIKFTFFIQYIKIVCKSYDIKIFEEDTSTYNFLLNLMTYNLCIELF